MLYSAARSARGSQPPQRVRAARQFRCRHIVVELGLASNKQKCVSFPFLDMSAYSPHRGS